MMKQMGDITIIQEALLKANQYLIGLGVVTALLIVFHSFLVVRIDGKTLWPYFTVFIPLFIIDIMALVYVARDIAAGKDVQDPESLSEEEKKTIATVKRMILVFFFLATAFQILVCLQLDGVTTMSWWIVFIPWFVIEA